MRLIVWSIILFLLAGCAKQPPPLVQQESFVFGTRVEVLVYGEPEAKARAAIGEVLREFDREYHAYHAWKPSELSTLNAAIAAGHPQQVSPELAALIRNAQGIAAKGNYLFDPGIGRLIGLWGFQSDEFKAQLPDETKLREIIASHPSIADIKLDGNRVTSSNRAVALDFGGYLKGVALDRAAALLKAQGVSNALINIGGNVMALGSKGSKPWRVGIQHPRSPSPLAMLELHDGEAIGTSGDYQRYFELDGKRYCHLLDPRSGMPVQDTRAVTVLITPAKESGQYATGMLSDVASKPIFIAGAGWREQAARLGVGHVLRIDAAGAVEITEALHKRLKIEAPDSRIVIVP